MNTKIYTEKEVDWSQIVRWGIDVQMLKEKGYMKTLLEGGTTEAIPIFASINNASFILNGSLSLERDETGQVLINIVSEDFI